MLVLTRAGVEIEMGERPDRIQEEDGGLKFHVLYGLT